MIAITPVHVMFWIDELIEIKNGNPHLGRPLHLPVAIPRRVFTRHDEMLSKGKQGLPHYLGSSLLVLVLD